MLLGYLVLGEGWHNNHHDFPYSARFGFRWWQMDFTWCVICLMERLGLVWRVRRPKTQDGDPNLAGSSGHQPPTRAYRPARGEATEVSDVVADHA